MILARWGDPHATTQLAPPGPDLHRWAGPARVERATLGQIVRMVLPRADHTSKSLTTTIVEVPYKVLLEAALRFADTTIPVEQHVLVGDRLVVCCASGEGYWYIPNDPELKRGDSVPRAVFEPDTNAAFTFRRLR